ncbi:MAG TPA: hypothetical protein V6C65_04175 [Allocoleopsis sp.]
MLKTIAESASADQVEMLNALIFNAYHEMPHAKWEEILKKWKA